MPSIEKKKSKFSLFSTIITQMTIDVSKHKLIGGLDELLEAGDAHYFANFSYLIMLLLICKTKGMQDKQDMD